jgi:hypothetical protein
MDEHSIDNPIVPTKVEPTLTVPLQPTPLEDLERRLKALRESGVRAYKDGPLEIIFSGQQRQAGSPMDEALRQFHDLEARAREAASGKVE